MEIGKWVSCLHSGKVEAAIAKQPLVSLSTFRSLVTNKACPSQGEWAGLYRCFPMEFHITSIWIVFALYFNVFHTNHIYIYIYLFIIFLCVHFISRSFIFQSALFASFSPPLHHQIPMARHLFTCHRIIPNRAHAANTSTGPVDPIITGPFLRMLENSHWGDQYFTTHQDSGLNNTTHY